MSLITKVIIDTTEYNRLLKIEEEYKRLREKFHGLKPSTNQGNEQQSGSGNICKCEKKAEKECHCDKTPPLSEIVALNEQAKAVALPPRGLLPSITDPNEVSQSNKKNPEESTEGEDKKRERLDHNEWKMFVDDKSNWYYLGHYEEN